MRQNFEFISLLRAIAVTLVVYDHLAPFWLSNMKLGWMPAEIVNKYINSPLAIIQDFGFFGVALFFLISGFLITSVLQNDTRKGFIVKRLFRILPALFFAFFLIYFIDRLFIWFGYRTYWSHFHTIDYLKSASLMNFILGEPNYINGVTWTLIIEILFYILCWLLLPVMQKQPRLSIILMLTSCVSMFLLYFATSNKIIHNIISSYMYVLFLIFGVILYYLWCNRIKFYEFILFSVCLYCFTVYTTIIFRPNYYESSNSQLVSFLYAYLVFIIALLLNTKITNGYFISFISNISYSWYLNHSTVGGIVLSLFYLKGFSLAFILAIVLSIIFSFLSYKYVEKPFIKLGRKILQQKTL